MTLPISGLNVSLQSGSNTLSISAGQARDASDAETISIPPGQSRSIDPSTTGVGGLDTGAIETNERYAVYVLKSTSGNVGGILSKSFDGSGVSWPGGGAPRYRRVGTVITGANGNFLTFSQTGGSNDRTVTWQLDLLEKVVVQNEDEPAWKFRSMEELVGPEAVSTSMLLKPSVGSILHIREANSGGGPLLSVSSETTWGFTPNTGADKMEFRTSNGAGSVYVLGFQETV